MTTPTGEEGMATEFVLVYRYEWCYDDGGIGHDSGWKDAELQLKAANRASALAEAATFCRQGRPCQSFGCGNRGRRVMVRVEKRESKTTVLR